MKTIILFITLLTITLVMLFISVNFVERMDAFDERLDRLKIEVQELRTEFIGYKVEIDDKTRPYDYVIPVSGGFLGVRE